MTFSPYFRLYHLDGNSSKNNVSASGVWKYIPFGKSCAQTIKDHLGEITQRSVQLWTPGFTNEIISKRSSVSLMSGGNTGKILFNKPNRETEKQSLFATVHTMSKTCWKATLLLVVCFTQLALLDTQVKTQCNV